MEVYFAVVVVCFVFGVKLLLLLLLLFVLFWGRVVVVVVVVVVVCSRGAVDIVAVTIFSGIGVAF